MKTITLILISLFASVSWAHEGLDCGEVRLLVQPYFLCVESKDIENAKCLELVQNKGLEGTIAKYMVDAYLVNEDSSSGHAYAVCRAIEAGRITSKPFR